jgi:exopolysaccharide biosynthesis polyprenyl glycosylphosphotransferase
MFVFNRAESQTSDPAAEPTEGKGVVRPFRDARVSPAALRGQVSLRQNVGRFTLVWIAAYVMLRTSSSVAGAIGQAALVTAVWLTFAHWAGQLFRVMTFAAGAFVVAATASLAGLATISALSYWARGLSVDHAKLAAVSGVSFLALGAWDYFVRTQARAPRRVLIIGAGPATAKFLDDLAREPAAGLDVIAIVDDHIEESLSSRVLHQAALKNLSPTIRRLSPDLVVIAVQRGRPEVFGQLLAVANAGFQVVGLPEIYEFAFGRLPVEELTPAWFMSVLHAYNRPANRLAKRAFDVVVALGGIAVALPFVPVLILLVKRTPGPLFYRQERVGEHGRTFTMLKFRSMQRDAEVKGQAQWASENDPRVIPGGRLMRLLRLDELPQFWNVLRGEMSIVGPRPERPEFLDHLEAEVPFWTQRLLLRPGITGWAQIRAAYAADALGTVEKLSYDLWYLRHRSIALDTIICLKTFPRMAMLRGAR